MHVFFSTPLLFVLLIIFSGCSSIYDAEENRRNLTTQFSSAQLLSGEMKVEQILNGEADKQFIRPPEKVLSGNPELTYWYKTKLSAALLKNEEYILEIPYPLLDKVDVWFRTVDGRAWHYQAGSLYPYADRAIDDPGLVFPVPKGLVEDIDIVIAVNTSSLLTFSVLLMEKKVWMESRLHSKIW